MTYRAHVGANNVFNEMNDDDDDFSPLQQKGFSFEFILPSGRVLSIHTNPYQALMIFTQCGSVFPPIHSN